MPVSYDESELPPEEIAVSNRTWRRDNFDTYGYQWARPMEDDEYDWNPDDVSLVGTDVPIRVVQLQYLDGEWEVTASETAGPEYHRPGFTELISGEFSYATSDLDDAVQKVEEFIRDLSGEK